ncbi:hypothetical protein [Sorangium sp. So ce385]|uniref:hypothetical protein n=1 Tax=Sorangium sp. So ce385 TaxID=3133308 RepID=UPI003F5B5119
MANARSDVHAEADGSVLAGLTDVSAIAAAAEPLGEAESFGTQTAYHALNRPTSVTAPDASEVKPTCDEAGLPERVEARVRGAVAWTTFVDDTDDDAKGQRHVMNASERRERERNEHSKFRCGRATDRIADRLEASIDRSRCD